MFALLPANKLYHVGATKHALLYWYQVPSVSVKRTMAGIPYVRRLVYACATKLNRREDCDVIDLAGAVVLPGLQDAHLHIGFMGERWSCSVKISAFLQTGSS